MQTEGDKSQKTDKIDPKRQKRIDFAIILQISCEPKEIQARKHLKSTRNRRNTRFNQQFNRIVSNKCDKNSEIA